MWVIAHVYERDIASVGVGGEASVSLPSGQGTPRCGRITYADGVDPATRTAKVRIEVENRGDLKLGMFVSVTTAGPGQQALMVPRTAGQTVSDRNVVYVVLDEGRFVERAVRLGPTVGDSVAVVSGLHPTQRVVTRGSYFLRAEAARNPAGG